MNAGASSNCRSPTPIPDPCPPIPALRYLFSGMGYDEQSLSPCKNTVQSAAKIFRIERGETFIQHYQIRFLKQCAGYKEPALLAVRKLPSRLAYELQQARRHTFQKLAESQFAANGFSLLAVVLIGGPSSSH